MKLAGNEVRILVREIAGITVVRCRRGTFAFGGLSSLRSPRSGRPSLGTQPKRYCHADRADQAQDDG